LISPCTFAYYLFYPIPINPCISLEILPLFILIGSSKMPLSDNLFLIKNAGYLPNR